MQPAKHAHLQLELWYDKTNLGNLRLKRVSAAREYQFPREYREMVARKGPAATTVYIMQKKQISLAEAWHNLKMMVNG